METKQEDYGCATVGFGGAEQRKIAIKNYVKAIFLDNRLISICELDNEEGFIVSVENHASSGRNPNSTMWLSKESFVGLQMLIGLYLNCKETNTRDVAEASKKEGIEYYFSDNLTPFDPEKKLYE